MSSSSSFPVTVFGYHQLLLVESTIMGALVAFQSALSSHTACTSLDPPPLFQLQADFHRMSTWAKLWEILTKEYQKWETEFSALLLTVICVKLSLKQEKENVWKSLLPKCQNKVLNFITMLTRILWQLTSRFHQIGEAVEFR